MPSHPATASGCNRARRAGVRVRMERLARVATLWNWLPGFRAVAETENLHEAARSLEISPSALSRTIRLLEDQLERPLFDRTGRSLRLTAVGASLLGVVRGAMRAVDDVTASPADALRIAAPVDVAAMMLVPVLAQLRVEGRSFEARVGVDVQLDPVGRLLRGEVDVVLTCAEITDARLLCERITDIRVGLYVGPRHPMRDAAPSRADLLAADFVAYRAPGGLSDRWPESTPRRVALWVGDPRDAINACVTDRLIAMLPELLVAQCGAGLRRLPLEIVEPATLFAVRRRPLGPAHFSDVLVAALRRAHG